MPAALPTLDSHSYCPGCGYTLAGLRVPGTCPECSRRYFCTNRWAPPPPPSTLENLNSFCGPLLWFFAAFVAVNFLYPKSATLTFILCLFALPTILFTICAAPFWPFLASSKWLRRNAPPGFSNIGTFDAIARTNHTAYIFFVISVFGMPVPMLATAIYLYFAV